MAHLPRLMAEQAGNILLIVASLGDRLLLTSILYRFWNTSLFEQWASWSAAAALVSMFDLGFGLYFANRIAVEMERKNVDTTVRLYKICNFISFLTAMLGFLYAALSVIAMRTNCATPFTENSLSLVLLCAVPALRMMTNGPLALYRANRQYARQLTLLALGEIGRVFICMAIALAGGRPLYVAFAFFFTSIALQVAYILFDSMKRFEPHCFSAALPTFDEFRAASTVSFGFLMQIVPIQLLTNASVILLTQVTTESGVVASFVLTRTLVNFPRSFLQSFGIIMGIECARRCVSGEFEAARLMWGRAARSLAALSGLVGGLILAAGPDLFTSWTGSGTSYNGGYLFVLMLPMVLGVGSALNHNVLAAANSTGLPAAGRCVQLVTSLVLFWGVPISDVGMRMAVALSAGEILGFMPLSIVAMRRLAPRLDVNLEFQALLLSVLSMLVAAVIMWSMAVAIGRGSTAQFIVAFTVAGIVCGMLFPWLGVDKGSRMTIMATITQFLQEIVRRDLLKMVLTLRRGS